MIRTMMPLLLRPAFLSREYVAGRRRPLYPAPATLSVAITTQG
ncbi:DUF3667 domain-containing protein [Aliidiomarina minuta]